MRFVRLSSPLVFLSGVLLLSGCGTKHNPIQVQVTVDGKNVEGAAVTLVPAAGTGSPSTGETDSSGVATMNNVRKEGVAPGSYKVTVVKTAKITSPDPKDPKAMAEAMKAASKGGKPKNELPEIYADPAKTPLTLTVPLTSSPGKIELKSKP